MDQDTYEQLMRVQISLDELKEKMDLMLDEIDELKNQRDKQSLVAKQGQDSGQKQTLKDQHSAEQCGNQQTKEQQNQTHHTQTLEKISVKIPGWQSPGFK